MKYLFDHVFESTGGIGNHIFMLVLLFLPVGLSVYGADFIRKYLCKSDQETAIKKNIIPAVFHILMLLASVYRIFILQLLFAAIGLGYAIKRKNMNLSHRMSPEAWSQFNTINTVTSWISIAYFVVFIMGSGILTQRGMPV